MVTRSRTKPGIVKTPTDPFFKWRSATSLSSVSKDLTCVAASPEVSAKWLKICVLVHALPLTAGPFVPLKGAEAAFFRPVFLVVAFFTPFFTIPYSRRVDTKNRHHGLYLLGAKPCNPAILRFSLLIVQHSPIAGGMLNFLYEFINTIGNHYPPTDLHFRTIR
jgi:hypothetical protein